MHQYSRRTQSISTRAERVLSKINGLVTLMKVDMWPLLGIKYFGGHSDLLCGALVVRTLDEWT